MTQERINEIAGQLEGKAESVESGFYGKDDDNESWAADLRRAARRLRRGAFDELCRIDREEITCGSDCDEKEIDAAIAEMVGG